MLASEHLLRARVARALGQDCRLEPGSRILVAVSGGGDSIALLHLLCTLAPEYPLTLHAAHFHHRLRGADADEDARFVRETCGALGVPLSAGEASDPVLRRGASPEASAREARYAFLERAARETEAAAIALGHTRDDQAETVLMRLLVGAGPRGLAAMAARGPGLRIRPLLAISRARLRRYLAERQIPFREDPSNTDAAFLRNRIRDRVLPVIEREVNPAARRTLARAAETFRAIDAHLEAAAAGALERIARREEGKLSLAAQGLLSYDSALRRCMLRAAAQEVLGRRESLGVVHVGAVLKLLESGSTGASVSLPGGVRARLDRAELVILRDSVPASSGWGPVPLAVPGDTHLEAAGVIIRCSVEEKVRAASLPREAAKAVFDLDALHPPLVVRNRRRGDRFIPFGACGSRKVQDAFVDAKIPRHRRDGVPIVEDAEGILWLAGVRRGAHAPVDEATRQVLRLEVLSERR